MIFTDLYYHYQDSKNSKLSKEEFLDKYEEQLKLIEIGCSFCPEHEVFFAESDEERRKQNVLRTAKFIIEELKIKNIRLGIRWNNIWKNGQIDLKYYDKLFQYILSQDVNVCLNIGPIKTMRWPEEQVPDEILNSLTTIPAKRSVINSQSELAQISLKYLKDLLEYLSKYFSEDQLQKIEFLQGDNEAFYNFGVHEWLMSTELEINVLSMINKYFPDKKIMVSSAGRATFRQVLNLVDELKDKVKTEFSIGYNYYYRTPHQFYLPIVGYIDNLIWFNPFIMNTDSFRRICKDKNIQIEISELQGEPWLDLKSPGNSVQEFRFALLRCMLRILNLSIDKKSIVRYWGIEDLAMKFLAHSENKDNDAIKKLILKINSNS